MVKVGGEIAILSTKEAYSPWGRHQFWRFCNLSNYKKLSKSDGAGVVRERHIPAPFFYLWLHPRSYLWVDVILFKETPKAILIMFDGKKEWLPKAWILRIKRSKSKPGHCERSEAISIKISEYHWAKKL